MMQTNSELTKPWWKQLWPWLLIAGPAIAAIGCVITIYLAINVHADEQVRDGGFKVEQVQK
jgi:hypothetical protein